MEYNTRNPAVKRLLREAAELSQPTELYFTQPLEENLFEWHFTIRGPVETEFEEGIYHGRILLPTDYPMKPPNVIFLTPNGRFELHKKICLSISGYHPETWRPCWSIRTALLALIGFMPSHGQGAIGSLYYPVEERRKLAKKSSEFICSTCGDLSKLLKPVTEASKSVVEEAKKIATELTITDVKEVKSDSAENVSSAAPASTGSLLSASSVHNHPTVLPPTITLPPSNMCTFGTNDNAAAAFLSQFSCTGLSDNLAVPLSFTEWLRRVKGLTGDFAGITLSSGALVNNTATVSPPSSAVPPTIFTGSNVASIDSTTPNDIPIVNTAPNTAPTVSTAPIASLIAEAPPTLGTQITNSLSAQSNAESTSLLEDPSSSHVRQRLTQPVTSAENTEWLPIVEPRESENRIEGGWMLVAIAFLVLLIFVLLVNRSIRRAEFAL